MNPADVRRLSIDHLLSQHAAWDMVLEYDYHDDVFNAIAKVTALYEFAIANYGEPGIDLVLNAIAAVEAATSQHE